MLIPRFSLRLLLAIITVSSLFFFVVTLAVRGHDWALAITISISSLFAVFLLHAAVFAFAWLVTVLGGLFFNRQNPGSPFAFEKPPPQQIIPPEDVE